MEKVGNCIPPPLPPKTRRGSRNTIASSPLDTTSRATVTSSGGNVRCCNPDVDAAATTLATPLAFHHQSPAATPAVDKHVVKIRINPEQEDATATSRLANINSFQSQIQVVQQYPYQSVNNSCIRINVNDNEDNMIRTDNYMKVAQERANPYFFYGSFPSNGIISSGQSSPSDTLDSGTCSDLDGSTPPPLPKKKSSTTVTVTVNGSNHKRNCSLTSSGIDVDSDDVESNISCDSLNSHELENVIRLEDSGNNLDNGSVDDDDRHEREYELETPPEIEEEVITPVVSSPTPPPPPPKTCTRPLSGPIATSALPDGLLQDIRERSLRTSSDEIIMRPIISQAAVNLNSFRKTDRTGYSIVNTNVQIIDKVEDKVSPVLKVKERLNPRLSSPVLSIYSEDSLKSSLVHERTYEDRRKENDDKVKENSAQDKEDASNKLNKRNSVTYDEDRFYKFHLNETFQPQIANTTTHPEAEETFAGYKDYLNNNRSKSSTIRSAKGTVRGVKNRVRAGIATFLQVHTDKNYKEKEMGKVVVYTTTMGVVRATFHDCLKVKQILRTLMVKFEERDVMSREVQAEIRDRMNCEDIALPQVFVEGQHIGDAEAVERLNETGELRIILKPFKSADACLTCKVCGGYRLLPCPICNGSKKSVHRNEFTTEFVALKCMKCDEVGLVKCHAC